MTFTYIDLIALALIALFLWRGYNAGFWAYIARLVSLVAGIVVAFYAYAPVGAYIAAHSTLEPRITSVLAFVGVLLVAEWIVDRLIRILYRRAPEYVTESRTTRVLALAPALADALLVITLLVVASIALPLPTSVSGEVSRSYTGTLAARGMPVLQSALDRATGGRLSTALSELTTNPAGSEESRTLPFKASHTEVDPAAEARMLVLVNEERAKVGAPPLTVDPELVQSARAHSQDMWERQYFAHMNPDGDDPFDRMLAADATFLYAGENLALAPTAELAHIGLMRSPGHKRNILDPNFRRVGIGIVDGGIYGKMVTQNFAN
jgi:uncharacterized protein YkwD